MYDQNAQNTLLRIRTELNDCCYDPRMKDYLSNMIQRIMNYPKKTTPSRHYVKMMDQKKIMMIWYPMSVPFMNRNYNVPLQIYIMKNIPYEPPQIFLEVVQGSAANPSNRDIDPRTNKIMTNTLRSWNQYSIIENALGEIYESFSKVFPIYKKKNNQEQPQNQVNNQGASGGGGIYGMLKKEVYNLYQQNKNNNNNYNNIYNQNAYKPPATNIYGRSMTNEQNNNNNYNNQQQQPNSYGGGIYGNNYNNNQQQPNSFGGGIYGNNNNNNQQPNSFGGGIYGNNNQQPNSFGGGIYDNNNNNNNQGGGLYGNNDNNKNQYNDMYNQGMYGAPPPIPQQNPDEEFKKILIEEVSNKISNKLIEEKKRLKNQNNKLKEYKTIFSKENETLQNFVNGQNQIKIKCDEDMTNINNAVKRVQDYNNYNKATMLNEETCVNYIDLPDANAIKLIADETSMEEMIIIVKKGFERKKISFEEAVLFMRNTTRDAFAIKFLKDKMINKYKY